MSRCFARALILFCVAGLVSGCFGSRKSAPKTATRVEDMSSGRIQVTISAEPAKVELDKDILLAIKIVAPSEIEVAQPSLDDRLSGFVLNGILDEEPVVKDGKTTLERRARLTPVLADKYRVAPMAITYADKNGNPADSGWFPTRPIIFERVSPIDGSPPKDVESALKPVWVYPSFKMIALVCVAAAHALALPFLLWKLAKRARRQIKLMRMSPRERALFELSELMAKDLVGKNLIKEFYMELTMIVRRYIERRHAIRAPEQTTEEFLAVVSKDARFSGEVGRKLRAFLEAADLVKFAAHNPGADAISAATSTARQYVETDSPEA